MDDIKNVEIILRMTDALIENPYEMMIFIGFSLDFSSRHVMLE